jgi:hypothetical protein
MAKISGNPGFPESRASRHLAFPCQYTHAKIYQKYTSANVDTIPKQDHL